MAAHIRAMVNAGRIRAELKTGPVKVGNPRGMSPTTGAPWSHRVPAAVPASNATKGPGVYLANRRGHRSPTATVTSATATASKFKAALGHAVTFPIIPPGAVGSPTAGRMWVMIRTMPAAAKNPTNSEWGMYDTNRPHRTAAKAINMMPANIVVVNAAVSPYWAVTGASTSATKTLGPATRTRLLPATADTNPTATAP